MQIEQYAIIARVRSAEPFPAYPARVNQLIRNAGGKWMPACDFVVLSAQFCQKSKLHYRRTPVAPGESAKFNRKTKFLTGHREWAEAASPESMAYFAPARSACFKSA